MNKILKQLVNLFEDVNMTKEEVYAFCFGISNLNIEEQISLFRVFNYNRDMIYPSYINYMAKKRSKETGVGWDEAVKSEINFLDNHMSKKVVGAEII
jgi:hypothetical protein